MKTAKEMRAMSHKHTGNIIRGIEKDVANTAKKDGTSIWFNDVLEGTIADKLRESGYSVSVFAGSTEISWR